jgi:putative sterol carrier protein
MGPTLDHLRHASVREAGAFFAEADPVEIVEAVRATSVLRFLRLATGNLSAVTGVLRGQLKVRGGKAKALQLSSVIDFPKAR